MCLLFLTIFKRQMFFFLSSNEVYWKEIYLSVVFFPLFHKHLFTPGLPRVTRLVETCLEKITVCVIETMLVTLPLVQMNKAWMEVSRQIKHATVLRMYLNDWKNILWLSQLQFFVNQVVNLHIIILWILASCNSL